MSSKKLIRWIDNENYKTCLKIVQYYYSPKEEKSFFSIQLFLQFLKRIFFLFVYLFLKKPETLHKNTAPRRALLNFLGYDQIQPDYRPLKTVFEPLVFPESVLPLVSLIITVQDNLAVTYNCLLAVLEETREIEYEIMLVSQQPAGQTTQLLTSCKLKEIKADDSAPLSFFLNKAAASARGEYLCFLEDHTQVTCRWLENLLTIFKNDPAAGLAGASLLYNYGLIKEAGGLIDAEGKRIAYGQGMDPRAIAYNYIREADYCSGCFLVPKATFEKAGAFSLNFTTCNYAQADLCFSLKYLLHKKVLFQPLSAVIYFKDDVKREDKSIQLPAQTQETDSSLFAKKWSTILSQFKHTENEQEIAARHQPDYSGSILIIDELIPKPDQDSGSRRLFEIIKLFKSLNQDVYFLSHVCSDNKIYYNALINAGIKVLRSTYLNENKKKELLSILPLIDLVWISRPRMNEIYGTFIKKHKEVTWIYDTVDLHFIREQRELELSDTDPLTISQKIQPVMEQELKLANLASHTITVTEIEKQILAQKGIKNITVIPNVHSAHTPTADDIPFESRKNLVFIGGYAHPPNIDAAIWLAKEIMPLVWKNNPEIRLHLLGSGPTPEVQALKNERINVPGYIHDVSPYFMEARVFVAPLRYGAGMKGKIGQSLEYRLPVVSTDIGVEGMNLKDGYHVLVANDTVNFANKIIALYHDPIVWNKIRENSLEAIADYTPSSIKNKLIKLFNDLNHKIDTTHK